MVMTAPLKSVVYGAMNLELPTVYNLNDPPRSRFARKRAAIREDDGPQVKVSCLLNRYSINSARVLRLVQRAQVSNIWVDAIRKFGQELSLTLALIL